MRRGKSGAQESNEMGMDRAEDGNMCPDSLAVRSPRGKSQRDGCATTLAADFPRTEDGNSVTMIAQGWRT